MYSLYAAAAPAIRALPIVSASASANKSKSRRSKSSKGKQSDKMFGSRYDASLNVIENIDKVAREDFEAWKARKDKRDKDIEAVIDTLKKLASEEVEEFKGVFSKSEADAKTVEVEFKDSKADDAEWEEAKSAWTKKFDADRSGEWSN